MRPRRGSFMKLAGNKSKTVPNRNRILSSRHAGIRDVKREWFPEKRAAPRFWRIVAENGALKTLIQIVKDESGWTHFGRLRTFTALGSLIFNLLALH